MPNEMLLEERLGRIESEVFGTGYAPNVEGLPSALFMPADLQVETTTGPDGTLVTISWANWSPVVQTYEIWATGPDGRENLHATSKVGPVFFTLSVDAVEAWSFKVRPVVQDSTPALEFCPAVAANISPPAVGSADIAAGAVGDSHLDRFSANQIVVVGADIANATITQANMGNASIGTAQIIDLAVTNAKVVSLEAIKVTAGTFVAGVVYAGAIAATQISAGTITGVNVSAGTYSLTVGNNSMEINGTQGFRQDNTSTGRTVRIFNGTLQVGVSGSGEVTIETDDGFGGGQTGSGRIFVGDASENQRILLRVNTSQQGVAFFRGLATGDVVQIGGTGVFGQANSGYLGLYNSSASLRVSVGTHASGFGGVILYQSSGSAGISILATSGGGNQIAVANGSGSGVLSLGDTSGHGSLTMLDSGLTNSVGLIAHSTASLRGLSVNATRVVGPQQATVSSPSGGSTVDAEARTAINALISRLQSHGLIA